MPGFKINNVESERPGPNPLVEAIRSHRWRFEFTNIGTLRDVVVYAQSCQVPSVEIDVIEIHNRQTKIHMPGKYKWSPINVKFYAMSPDGGGPASNLSLFKYWSSGANAVVNFSNNTVNKDFRTQAIVVLEDGLGSDVHTYKLSNVWPSKVEGSELNYTSSELATISVTLVYDSADEIGA